MLSSFAVVVSTAGVCNAKVAQEPPRSNASDGGELVAERLPMLVMTGRDEAWGSSHRTAWWTNDRFGMFIHFGLYALPARHEWVKTRDPFASTREILLPRAACCSRIYATEITTVNCHGSARWPVFMV